MGRSALVFVIAVGSVLPAHARDDAGEPAAEVSQGDTESRVTDALAERLDVPASTVAVVKTEERTWPDRFLGCFARRGLTDSTPVAGYRIELEANDRVYVYHTDRAGRFIPCDKPKKPLGPIQ